MILRARIGVDGMPLAVNVGHSSGFDILDIAAIAAVWQRR